MDLNLFIFIPSFLFARYCVATVEKRALAHRVDGGGLDYGHFLGQAHEIAAVLVGAIAVEMQQMGDLRSDFWPVESIRVPRVQGETRCVGRLASIGLCFILSGSLFGCECTSMTFGVFETLSCPLHMLRWKIPSPPCQIALSSLPTPCPW